jgi:membrane protease YdiL (CAAX protease family)
MPGWTLFGGAVILLTVGFVWLARASARSVRDALEVDVDGHRDPATAVLESDRLLAANVLASHGVLLAVLGAVVWLTAIPRPAVGVGPVAATEVAVGVGLGVVLAAGNEASARLADRVALDHDEQLRARLAPGTPTGWLSLLLVVLPLVAGAEELLFRGALVGGLAAGFGLPAWGLVVASSVLFGLGHGLQGPAGVVVTTGLGLVLGAAFVLTGSPVVVVILHYPVNVIAFTVNAGLPYL